MKRGCSWHVMGRLRAFQVSEKPKLRGLSTASLAVAARIGKVEEHPPSAGSSQPESQGRPQHPVPRTMSLGH